MSTPKLLSPAERRIYHPELATCPHCGAPTQLLNYLASDKTIQTLTAPLSLASRPSHCPQPTCPGFALRLRSVAARHLALPGGTYGRDVVAHLGWLRQHQMLTFAQVQSALAPAVQISESQVRTLYQEAYLPLLAVSARTHAAALTLLAAQHGGLLLALDGLAPVGGEPQLWCVYEVLTGLLLRAGWLSQIDQAAFAAFLQPLAAAWPVRAVLSDKQVGLAPAIGAVFPQGGTSILPGALRVPPGCPPGHGDADLASTVRKAVRAGVGPYLRAETPLPTATSAVLTVTGLVPEPRRPTGAPAPPASAPLPSPAQSPNDPESTSIVCEVLRRVRYLLTLSGQRPDRWAGLEVVSGLEDVLALSQQLVAHRAHPVLTLLVRTLETALAQVDSAVARLRQGVGWLSDIRTLLDPTQTLALTGADVAASLSAYLERIEHLTGGDSFLGGLVEHLWGVSRRYWPGLFHTYDQDGLPRTNNALESRFREVRRRLKRITGQAGATAAQLQRVGAWELIPPAASEAEQVVAFADVDAGEWEEERARVRAHQARFRLHSRNAQRTQAQLDRLRQAWLALPAEGTG